MSKISVLMTIFNEVDFVDYAIRACLPYVDDLVIVEGAYQETIACGAEPRSTDGTREKIEKLNRYDPLAIDYDSNKLQDHQFHYIEANEATDKDQRNVGLEKIKELNPDGWLLIIDGDEIYSKTMLKMVQVTAHNMERSDRLAAYFKSLTFVNDLRHYVEQEFPRLFRITPECKFVNDNFMEWPDKGVNWFTAPIIKCPQVQYHHYAFCKTDRKRFLLKKKWWETRFGKPFDYGWEINDSGKIEDPKNPNHKIREYTGLHPDIMKTHMKWKEIYE